uniref:Cathepsin L-like protein 1 n=1 Tax=Tigriopus japonicus TaxID=158387 RepID=A0A0H4K820_TIGJA|nr:cathepsin L-like protein 1 [Tigriopus japonicus]
MKVRNIFLLMCLFQIAWAKLSRKHYLEKAYRHNLDYINGIKSFAIEINEAILNPRPKGLLAERSEHLLGLSRGSVFISPAHVELPTAVDWRDLGAVTPVKNQASCGSCWAFGATGALEGQIFRKTGKLLSLSEQQLVDCTKDEKYHNNGCDGGLPDAAYRYIRDVGGIESEEFYPYVGNIGKCMFNKSEVVAEDNGYVSIPSGDEEALKAAVATMGPIVVGIDANHDEFMMYASGIYDNEACLSDRNSLDHAVLVVGYGTDSMTKKDFWLVKNSWGTNWGANGYIKMARNRENQCGIATYALYPSV